MRGAAGLAALLLAATFAIACAHTPEPRDESVRAQRLVDAPIIHPGLHPSLGENIQGPSLIRVPDWAPNRLGRYYLYFADHKGRYIRLAYADTLEGPWSIHAPGSLQLEDSGFPTEPPEASDGEVRRMALLYRLAGVKLPHSPRLDFTTPHIASPDVHVDHERRQIVMYFHGLSGFAEQTSRVALSSDGIHFEALPETAPKTYLRAFRYRDTTYALAMPGQFYRSGDGLFDLEPGPRLFDRNMRHSAVWVRGDTLWVFWTRVGDAPERILLTRVELGANWLDWRQGTTTEVLRPERAWEGSAGPVEPSQRSVAYGLVNQLRDPALFHEEGRSYLLYAVGGESGIGLAELHVREAR
ncbi:MAG: hypothetical protein AAF430_07400 [Myxococcota bacterium]